MVYLTLSAEEVAQRLANGDAYVIRFKHTPDTEILVNDIIRGEVRINSNILDDKVLYKSDGMPTYHLANIVDDHLMDITHVIRGEEWLPSAPLHVMLYKAFGWEAPRFAHLPLLLKPDGNGKLSKRDGDRLGFPVFPLQWKDPKSYTSFIDSVMRFLSTSTDITFTITFWFSFTTSLGSFTNLLAIRLTCTSPS